MNLKFTTSSGMKITIETFVVESTANDIYTDYIKETAEDTIERHRCKTARLYSNPEHVFIKPLGNTLPDHTITAWLTIEGDQSVVVFMVDNISDMTVREIFQKNLGDLTLRDLMGDGWKDEDDRPPRPVLRIVKP